MDVTPEISTTLRPLGIGELLDRAVTLCVRHFWALAAIYVGFAVLGEALQFVGGNDRAKLMNALTQVLQSQAAGKPPPDLSKTFAQYSSVGVWSGAAALIDVLLLPLPLAAMTAAAGAFSFGRTLSIGAAYRVAFRAWFQVLLLGLVFVVGGACAYLAAVIVAVLAALVIGVLSALSKALAVGLGIVLAIAFVGAVLVAATLVALAYEVAFCTCVLEGANFWDACLSGLRRVFRGVGLRRSALAGLAYFAVLLGILVVSAVGQGVLIGLVKSELLGSLFAVVVNVAAGAFATVFLVLFYYDLRVREDGLDLQAAASALAVDPSPAR